jgi:5-hydroxyisourate hydrolase
VHALREGYAEHWFVPDRTPERIRDVISTHILDATLGRPAVGVAVRLESADGAELGSAVTNSDGRIVDLAPRLLQPGAYRLVFDTGAYFAARDQAAFYPEVVITFGPLDSGQGCHVPLLLSPYGYSTYRGS